jgi:hypothetical protein
MSPAGPHAGLFSPAAPGQSLLPFGAASQVPSAMAFKGPPQALHSAAFPSFQANVAGILPQHAHRVPSAVRGGARPPGVVRQSSMPALLRA